MILSGGSDGLVAVSSPTTGMTVRVISDHKGAPITGIDVTFTPVSGTLGLYMNITPHRARDVQSLHCLTIWDKGFKT